MKKSEVFVPSRRSVMVGAVAAASAPGATAARELTSSELPTPEGTGGPGKILVWVEERHWRALIAAARPMDHEA